MSATGDASSVKQPPRRKPKTPTITVTFAVFDSVQPRYRVKREGLPIDKFLPLTLDDYHPRGGTPLRDATAHMIGHGDTLRKANTITIMVLADESGSMSGNEESVVAGINEFVDGMRTVDEVDPKAAGKVFAVVVTDGRENQSTEVDQAKLQAMVSKREDEGWTFIFLGANIDAWAQGAALGFSGTASGQTVNYVSSPTGTRSAMATVTADAQGFLADSVGYTQLRTNSAKRSISEDGKESIANQFVPGLWSPDDVAKAVKQAKDAAKTK